MEINILYFRIFLFFSFLDLIQCDPCSENKYTIIDEYKRSPNFRSNPSERRLCDNKIEQGWYRFKINGSDAEMPTKCIQHGCGTRAPLWLSPPVGGLPQPGKKSRSNACASLEVPGRELICCGLQFPVTIKNCGEFFVYRLRSTKGCDLAYCAEVVKTVCNVGQMYVLHLQKCVDIVVEISKPKLHVKKYQDRVSIVCLFDVYNSTVSQHNPTFSVTWIRVRNGVSNVIKLKFLSDNRDHIVLGTDVLTGDSVACEVMPVHQKNSQMSELLFLGIQVMESDVILRENGPPQTLTFISTVPLFCKEEDKKCKLSMVLTVKYPRGNILSDLLLSHCILEFHPNDRCQGIGCITQEVKVAMTPNLYTLEVKDVSISGYLYVDEEIMWHQDSLKTKVKVIDLPSVSCFVTAGVFILSFQNSISKVSKRGTYVMFKSQLNDMEIHIRTNTCKEDGLLCVCAIALYYKETRYILDRCRAIKDDFVFHYHPAMRANMKIYEGRHGKLIYIVLDSKAHIRIDLRQTSMSVTLQASGYFTDKADGLCGHIGNQTLLNKNDVQTNQPLVNWRISPVDVSLFDNYEMSTTASTSQGPECDCSLSSYQTSCPKSSATLPHFLLQLKETTFYWMNKTQTTNQITGYDFDGDLDVDEVVTRQPSKDGHLANNVCTKMFMTSGIAKTCLNRIKINIESVINVCVALATSYRNSTWMPEVLRLLENLCETHLNQEINSTTTGEINDINIDDIRQAILCPEGCYGNGICTESGCICFHGYSGIECLTKAEEVSTTSTTKATPSSSTKRTTTTSSSTTATTTTTAPTTSTTTTAPTTSTTTTTPTTSTTTTTAPTTSTTTIATRTTSIEKLTTTTTERTTTNSPLSMTSCDTRESSCSTVYVDLSHTWEFALKCYITLMEFTATGWEPVGTVYTTLLRYIDRTTVECMLPMVTNNDNFVNVYRIQVPDGGDNMLRTQLLAVVDGLCQICDVYSGCMLKAQTCFVDKRCYRHGDLHPRDACLLCDITVRKNKWSPRTDYLPPRLLDPGYISISALEGDTIKTNITAVDPEHMDMFYSTDDTTASISTQGEVTWHVSLSDGGDGVGLYKLVINVTDSCGAVSFYVLMVVVKSCPCENGGFCENQIVSKNRTEYDCKCPPTFTGNFCETRVNRCHSNPCYPGVDCTETTNSFKCGNCSHGYQGDGVTCTKSCSSQPCFPGVICKDLTSPHTGFVCGSCPQYFYGNGEKCYRNDDKACDDHSCSPLVSCKEIKDYPGYHCGICPHGYMGNGSVCEAFCFPPCRDGQECIDHGVCGCREGYTGPNCNQAICQVKCQNGGICYQPDRCFCSPGYTGKYCETELCPHGCMNGGSCIGVNICACLPGFRGHRCEIESCSITCLNGGTCVGFNRCHCTPEYKGIFCEQAVCDPDCLNGGVCVRPGVCYCPMGFHGHHCETAFCYPPCESGGYCLAGNQCQCQPGFTGSYCQFKYCMRNVCQNGGRCVGPEICACRSGWEGKYCRKPTCHLGCQNGGYCYLPNRCQCQPGYWGPFCQFPECYPPCAYGSTCINPNQCSCRKYYTGKYCTRRKR